MRGGFTEVLPALVLVDVYIYLLDGLQSLSQLGPVMVALWRGPQQLHQQQWVTHHSLHWLDQERAKVDVICFPPEKVTEMAGNVLMRGKQKHVAYERDFMCRGITVTYVDMKCFFPSSNMFLLCGLK